MKLYESLVKNVGIGKEPLVRRWIKDNTRVGDRAYEGIKYKDGKLSYNYLDLFLKEEIPDYIAFDNVKYLNLLNMSKDKLKLNPSQLPEESECIIIDSFDLTNTTLKLNLRGVGEIAISDCVCKNTVIDAPNASLRLDGTDFVKGMSSKNIVSIELSDAAMMTLISRLRDVDDNIRRMFKNFPALNNIHGDGHTISKATGKWVLD